MMIMVLCAGFTFAQNTVRGFVPGAATGAGDNQTYVVFGQMFGDIDPVAANPYEVAEGLAQAQLVADTVEAVVGCGDSLTIGEFHLSAAAIQQIVDEFAANTSRPRDTFLTIQHPNIAIYNYDKLLVLHLFVCPCTVNDADNNPYDVIAIDNTHCWTKSNMRTTKNCAGEAVETMSYTSEIVSSLNVDTFGLLYKWTQAMTGSDCDSIYKTGICPCGWHLPTAAETARILEKNTDDLRSAEGDYWVVAENITNLTKFSAQPSGYYKGLAERFEGYHSEADFWYADNDSNCVANYFQILYYCNLPKQEYRSVDTDAMSVRCVLDMIYDYRQDNPTPNPNPNPQPQPTPTKTCNVSSVTVTPVQNDPKSIMITITPVTAPLTAEDLASVKVTVTSYTVLNATGALQVDDNPVTVSLDGLTPDGTLTWTYTPTTGDQLQAITGIVNVNGVASGSDNCGAEVSFNTASCDLSVSATFVDNVPTITINHPDYLSDQDPIFARFYFYDNVNNDGNPLGSVEAELDNPITNADGATIAAHIPSTFIIPPQAVSVLFSAWISLSQEHYDCVEDDGGLHREATSQINNTTQPTIGYTCPDGLDEITAPSTTMEYDYYCKFNGDASSIQEVTVTYYYYVPGNTNPAFSLSASNVVKQQYGEIQFNNPTAQQLQGHSLDYVDSIMIQVHATLDQSCSTNFIDQTLTFPVQH